REIDWLLEDAEGRLDSIIKNLIDPRQEKSVWITTDGKMAYGHGVNSPGQTSKIVSDICDRVFSATPLLNSEGLNRRHPTAQQSEQLNRSLMPFFLTKPMKPSA